MSALFPHPAAKAVNHVLRSAPLAMERLGRHAGRTADFRLGPFHFALTVQTTGEVTPAVAGASPDLKVRISAFALPRIAAGEEVAFREIEMQGDMEFAREISYLARNLTWDVEEDLSKVVGDIAAHRIAAAGRAISHWSRDASVRVAQGATEYWTEESPLIASRVKIGGFVRGVAEVSEAMDRLDKRIARLESPD